MGRYQSQSNASLGAILDNLPWHALNTEHARFAMCRPAARKYPADIAPFAGTRDNSKEAVRQLAGLLDFGETVYVIGDEPPGSAGLVAGARLAALRMIAYDGRRQTPTSRPDSLIVRMRREDAAAMVALTDIAYPGFFRPRTCEMGSYYGIRIDGQLIAMAGERMAVPQYREISGVCTHHAHTGKGYAASLISHVMREHAQAGVHSFLHVDALNARAIALYERLGFSVEKEVFLHPLTRCTAE